MRRPIVAAAACCALALPGGHAAAADSPTPSCAGGPVEFGDAVYGTPCDDWIVAPPDVALVDGGGGDDTIVAAPIAAAADCTAGCFLDVGSQTFEGGPGNDVVYGERGNDRLDGGGGDDRLFGGLGDDELRGGPGDDRLSGGFGADSIDGGGDDDYVRGDATQDEIVDRGGGTDTLSYSTGIAPGFFDSNPPPPDFSAVPGLPPLGGERGVHLDLSADPEMENGDDGVAQFGGGVDKVEGADFEAVIGTAFSDYIVGSDDAEVFYGGGGGDVILAGDGDDTLYGGADGDHLDGGEGADAIDGGPGDDHCASPTAGTSCESATNTGGVVVRDQSKVAVGHMTPGGTGLDQLYLNGSEAADTVTATYSPGSPASVSFALGSGSAPFDPSSKAAGGCAPPSGGQVVCQLSGALDSVVLSGFGGDDDLAVSGFPPTVGLVLTGGEGNDSLTGSDLGEDVLVGGTGDGDDVLEALSGDDALTNNAGDDRLYGGEGNDLVVSDSICDHDVIDGGTQRDNASWTRYKSSDGVAASLALGTAGAPGSGGNPSCGGGDLAELIAIEDLEGSPQADSFTGNGEENQLLGWAGADTYSGGAGEDRILANSGDFDQPVACGDDDDVALIDFSQFGDVADPDCEYVQESAKNSFRVENELEVPPEPPPPEPEPAKKSQQGKGGGRNGGAQISAPPCLGATHLRSISTKTRCTVRPHRLQTGTGGLLKRLRWQRWDARHGVGFGQLVAGRGQRRLGSAKVIASRPRQCRSRNWFTRLRVVYGRGYRRVYLRGATNPTPCAIRLRRDGQH